MNTVMIQKIEPMFSVRRLAEFFDVKQDTVLGWWHAGKIPPPDFRQSRRKIYWKPETIKNLVDNGGVPICGE
jgi:predicted site-specific integrase-resolvase